MQDDRFENRRNRGYERWVIDDGTPVLGYHVMMRLCFDTGIARKGAVLRRASSIVIDHGRDRGLAAHRFADTHLHTLVMSSRVDAGKFALYAEAGLRKRLRIRVPFERCRIRPIGSERYLGNVVRYFFKQEDHHGTAFDLAHDGSSLPDLIGLRVGNPWLAERVREAVPRLRLSSLTELLNAPGFEEESPDVTLLGDAAAAAFGLPSLRGGTILHASARAAAVQVVDRLSLAGNLPTLLEIGSRSVSRYRSASVDDKALRAVELQLRLRSYLRRTADTR